MKKIIFTVFIFVSLTISCTQVDEEVTPEISNNYLKEIKFNTNSSMFDYVTKTKSNVDFENDSNLILYVFLNTDFDKQNFNVSIQRHNLNNERDILYSLDYKNKDDFTNCYILYDTKMNEFTTYYIKIFKDEYIEVFNKDRAFIYSSLNVNGYVKLTTEKKSNFSLYSRSCFQYCMDYVEDQITDDLVGWAAWNLSPATQIAAAIGCDRACKPRLGF